MQYNDPFRGQNNAPISMPTPDFSINYSAQPNYPTGNYGFPPQNNAYCSSTLTQPPPPQSNQYGSNLYPNQTNPAPPNIYPNLPQNDQYTNVIPNIYNGNVHTTNDWNYQQPAKPVYDYNRPVTEGSIKPNSNFNPMDDATKLYKAMKGVGTDETSLIDVLCKRTNNERLQIASTYKTAYGKDLLKDVKSETSGNFGLILVGLLIPRIEYEAHELKTAIVGAGTDENALIDIICTKTNAEILQLKNIYRQLFHKEIEKDIQGDVSGYFMRILVSILNANRSEAPADMNRARQLANELFKAGEKRWGTDEVKFNQIFACESLPQLKLVFEEYYKLTGHDIEKAIKSEMSGDVKNAFLAITQIAKYSPGYYAERLYKSMKGLGTDDRTLIRNMVLRSEIDMREIKMEFQKKYSKTLESFIKGDCSGDYKRALLALTGDPHWK